jgi:hypothetical protein
MATGQPPEWEELVVEIAHLEHEERHLSAVRRKLHDRIDLGYSDEHTRERERQVSDQRRELQRRIDTLRELCNKLAPGTPRRE